MTQLSTNGTLLREVNFALWPTDQCRCGLWGCQQEWGWGWKLDSLNSQHTGGWLGLARGGLAVPFWTLTFVQQTSNWSPHGVLQYAWGAGGWPYLVEHLLLIKNDKKLDFFAHCSVVNFWLSFFFIAEYLLNWEIKVVNYLKETPKVG